MRNELLRFEKDLARLKARVQRHPADPVLRPTGNRDNRHLRWQSGGNSGFVPPGRSAKALVLLGRMGGRVV
jgi:hypothetical protein